jgi:hypothetical protein
MMQQWRTRKSSKLRCPAAGGTGFSDDFPVNSGSRDSMAPLSRGSADTPERRGPLNGGKRMLVYVSLGTSRIGQ